MAAQGFFLNTCINKGKLTPKHSILILRVSVCHEILVANKMISIYLCEVECIIFRSVNLVWVTSGHASTIALASWRLRVRQKHDDRGQRAGDLLPAAGGGLS